MTNEQINRAVAEELGYRVEQNQFGFYQLKRGDEIFSTKKSREDRAWEHVPDFCNDHNAAAEMRKVIKKDDEQVRFSQVLCDLTFQGHEDIMPEYYWTLLNATPRQQAEAFLRMRGKWRDG